MDDRKHVILCGVDGSAASEQALAWAVDESIRRGWSLRAVTAWQWDGADLAASPSPAAALLHAEETQNKAVDAAVAAAEKSIEVERLVPRGIPSTALCQAALDADLVVLGSHGHGQVHDKIVGSTSQRVIHHATCPVVVLPDPRHAEREKAKRTGVEPPLAPMRLRPFL